MGTLVGIQIKTDNEKENLNILQSNQKKLLFEKFKIALKNAMASKS